MRQRKRRKYLDQVKVIYITMIIGTVATVTLLLSEHQELKELKRTMPELVCVTETEVDAE